MTRQLEQKQEDRTISKALSHAKAMNYGLAEEIQQDGGQLIGTAFTHYSGSCRMVIKAEIRGVRQVAFLYSDDATGCVLQAYSKVIRRTMPWGEDKYHQE